MKKFCTLLICMVCFLNTKAQNITINGYIKDAATTENINNAEIIIKSIQKKISSNIYGFYSLTIPKGDYELSVDATGYDNQTLNLKITNDTTINVELLPKGKTLNTVALSSKKKDLNVTSTQMGKVELSISEIKNVPALLGEVDLIKVYQFMPGVRNAGEGNAGFYVRGGGPDQNLILLDEAVVYNVSHLFGFFSVFNADAVKSTSLIKGGMPAEFGGRISSVLQINMKEGNMKEYKVDGGIGLISSRLAVQGPIWKDKISFIVTGRRTYIDILTQPLVDNLNNGQFKGSGYYFYDVNAKINYKISEKDRIYLSAYTGLDKATLASVSKNSSGVITNSSTASFLWGNFTSSLRWNHLFTKKIFSNLTLFSNQYDFNFNGAFNTVGFGFNSGIVDYGSKYDLDFYFNKHQVKAGLFYTYHTFTPTTLSFSVGSVAQAVNNPDKKYSHETAAYIQDDWDALPNLKINAGLRFSTFSHVGAYTEKDPNILEADGSYKIIKKYGSGEHIQTYFGFEPRFSLRYALSETQSIKFGYNRNLQYVHLVSTSGSFLPTDVWSPSTKMVKPQIGNLYALGYFQNFKDNAYESSVEIYYKTMDNQIEYREGYTPNNNDDPELNYVFGKGWSYGAEFFVKKNVGKLTGWIGYTLSWTYRQFADINKGEAYFAKYDRRHDMSIVLSYKLNNKWNINSAFVYGSGNLATMPNSFYYVGGRLVQEVNKINNYRLPSYHRMDIGFSYQLKSDKNPNRQFKHELVFGFYNVYSNPNPFLLFVNTTTSVNQQNPLDSKLIMEPTLVSLFPILPSITWNFSF